MHGSKCSCRFVYCCPRTPYQATFTHTQNNMHLTSTLFSVFASAAMAVPAAFNIRDDDACAPASYTISDYTLTISPTSGSVDLNFKSTFPSPATITDAVQNGAHCSASGASVPNSNECQVANRRLLFDLRGPQEQAYYQITHTWSCNGYVSHFDYLRHVF